MAEESKEPEAVDQMPDDAELAMQYYLAAMEKIKKLYPKAKFGTRIQHFFYIDGQPPKTVASIGDEST